MDEEKNNGKDRLPQTVSNGNGNGFLNKKDAGFFQRLPFRDK